MLMSFSASGIANEGFIYAAFLSREKERLHRCLMPEEGWKVTSWSVIDKESGKFCPAEDLPCYERHWC